MKPRALLTFVACILAAAGLVAGGVRLEAQRHLRREAGIALDRGVNLYHQKSYAESEAALLWALRNGSDDWRAPFYLGTIQIEKKLYGSAIPFLERALARNPAEPKILNAMGVAYFKLGRVDMAKAYFWASLDLDPSNSHARGLMETMAKLQRRAARSESGED